MKKLATLSPGSIFNFAGERFVVMEQRDGAAFVLLAQSKESCPFNDKDDAENRNDYTHSTLKERIDKWVEALPRTSEEAAAILPFEVDLSCTDRSKSYGTITVKAAPLTLWQYKDMKEIMGCIGPTCDVLEIIKPIYNFKASSYPGVRVPIHHEGVKKMNRNLNEAIFDIAKVEAIMFAFENTYLELDVAPADRARADMATDAFYALWDAIRKVSDDLDRLAGDCRVVDAIYAVNDVRRRVGTLKTED